MKSLTRYVAVAILFVLLMLVPMAAGGGGTTAILEQIFCFGLFAMSYDLLIGYTGIVSFGHAIFFGTGAYAVAIILGKTGGTTEGLVIGFLCAIVLSIVLSLIIAFLSLRVKSAYFAMITLAVGQMFFVLAGSQGLRGLTNANDGISVTLPDWLNNDFSAYYFCFVLLVVLGVCLLRFVRSPVGRVLQGIRENERRTLELGHPVFRYKVIVCVLSGVAAAIAGGAYAVAQSFVSTGVYDVSTVSLNVLLMTIIGGTGTLFGGLIGAAIILFAQTEFSNLAAAYPIFNEYMIVFGILYIVIVRFVPRGILGTFIQWRGRVRWASQPTSKSSKI
ncbi:branched-chain amino acid ABC transporter permease [Alicyclobacillus dauci]|uniref:Branched-chain amino acid ABC transporter permease n=1 Tax=Alicyclobacillus dauci TaxID=1475485 RepID=A0ABY6Z1D8_9BACL|nr:branched-chain amino acid ABC transporter permease [Alicyclobacillus dauci]WAH36171.1 branched-chain amino acid ABC transporter permease [Alicyclobacillus dauci]